MARIAAYLLHEFSGSRQRVSHDLCVTLTTAGSALAVTYSAAKQLQPSFTQRRRSFSGRTTVQTVRHSPRQLEAAPYANGKTAAIVMTTAICATGVLSMGGSRLAIPCSPGLRSTESYLGDRGAWPVFP